MAEPEKTTGSEGPEGPQGPSQPFGAVLCIFFILIVVGYNGRDSWWGLIPHLLALGFLRWGALETYNPKTLAHNPKQHPRETQQPRRLDRLPSTPVRPGVLCVLDRLPVLGHWLD